MYVSEPAGSPGRKLTDGPADAQPAPSPDLSHVAFVRKKSADDFGGELWVLEEGSSQPRTAIADVAAAAQGPVWGADDVVAYLEASTENALVVTDLGKHNPKKIDTGVDSFAWAP